MKMVNIEGVVMIKILNVDLQKRILQFSSSILCFRTLFPVLAIILILISVGCYGQKPDSTKTNGKVIKNDTTTAKVKFTPGDTTVFQRDTIQDRHNDVSPLDIGSSRGIFILSSNRMLQLRILGSVRSNFSFSNQDLVDYQTFNPYYIPTEINNNTPNFYAGLEQTRLAFEVTRRTVEMGDVFIRLEGDFKNNSKTFRIRHAYGQLGRWLLGQTWSLMNNVSYQPAFVSLDGPVGGSGARTPQIRYSRNLRNKKMIWNAAIEYSLPSFSVPDSVSGQLLQVIPDFSSRLSYFGDKLSFRFAVVISTISGRIEKNDISYSFGFGASFSSSMIVSEKTKLYLTLNSCRATSHFLDTFSGNRQDMTYNPNTGRFEALLSTTGFIAVDHTLAENISASISFGVAAITNRSFEPADAFSHSYNGLFNLFWQPITGARLGLEYASGQRFDYGGGRGNAHRVSILMYYDF